MTDTLSAAKDGAAKARSAIPNKDAPEGSVINGRVMIWIDGLLRPATPSQAWSEWLWLAMSPLPETQARARAIRAALNQVGHLQ